MDSKPETHLAQTILLLRRMDSVAAIVLAGQLQPYVKRIENLSKYESVHRGNGRYTIASAMKHIMAGSNMVFIPAHRTSTENLQSNCLHYAKRNGIKVSTAQQDGGVVVRRLA